MIANDQIDRMIEALSDQGRRTLDTFHHVLDDLNLDRALVEALMPEQLPEHGYQRRLIHSGKDFELVAAIWSAGGGTLIHDHGSRDSQGLVRVLKGSLYNRVYRPSARGGVSLTDTHRHRRGELIEVPRGLVHAMGNLTDDIALSLHLYSPAIVNVNYWDPTTLAPYSA